MKQKNKEKNKNNTRKKIRNGFLSALVLVAVTIAGLKVIDTYFGATVVQDVYAKNNISIISSEADFEYDDIMEMLPLDEPVNDNKATDGTYEPASKVVIEYASVDRAKDELNLNYLDSLNYNVVEEDFKLSEDESHNSTLVLRKSKVSKIESKSISYTVIDVKK